MTARLRSLRNLFPVFAVLALAGLSGCGWIADEDSIEIARMDGKSIRYGELKRSIREMSDDERPLIENRGDQMRALNQYIDGRIKSDLKDQLLAEKKIAANRDLARQIYFAKYPDHMTAYQVPDPALLDMTAEQLEAFKTSIEFGIDHEQDLLLREQALAHVASEAFRTGLITLSDQEYKNEYQLSQSQLVSPELIRFHAIVFSLDAIAAAAEVRTRIDAGEAFETLAAEHARRDPNAELITEFERDPSKLKFRAFWENVEGSSAGDILGPISMPDYERIERDANGRDQIVPMPAAILVLKVIDHAPEAPLAFEQAKQQLTSTLATRKMMEILREQHGVQLFEDKLPDPAGFGDQYKDSFIRNQ